jgi:hypothetical protein
VNIAAVMSALEVDDLDHSAKHALVVVACRASRGAGLVNLPIGRVARDMQVTYKTALKALNELVESGYLEVVDKSPGHRPTWYLKSVVSTDSNMYSLHTPNMYSVPGESVLSTDQIGTEYRPEDSLEKREGEGQIEKQELDADAARHPASGIESGENPLFDAGGRPDFEGLKARLQAKRPAGPPRSYRR